MTNIKKVAEVAGVSYSTVSRVLNGKENVSEEKRRAVEEAVRKTQYQPNILAQSLKKGQSSTLCLLVPSIANPIFPEIARGVDNVARKNGFQVFLCATNEDEAIEKQSIEEMKKRWIDGFIVTSHVHDSSHLLDLRAQGYPVVLVSRYTQEDVGKLDIVSSDNYRVGYEAVDYLIRIGHRRIAYAQGRENMLLYQERLRGYRQALKDHKIAWRESYIQRGGDDDEKHYDLTKKLMSRKDPPTAIFCASDPKAFVVMRALHDMGFAIPEQISVMGVDDVTFSSMIEPPLTTMAQDLFEMGATAARSVIRQIRFKDENGILPVPQQTMIPPSLIVRRSTRPREERAGKPLKEGKASV